MYKGATCTLGLSFLSDFARRHLKYTRFCTCALDGGATSAIKRVHLFTPFMPRVLCTVCPHQRPPKVIPDEYLEPTPTWFKILVSSGWWTIPVHANPFDRFLPSDDSSHPIAFYSSPLS